MKKIAILFSLFLVFTGCTQNPLSLLQKEAPSKEVYEKWSANLEKENFDLAGADHFLLGSMAFELFQKQTQEPQSQDKTPWLEKAEGSFLRATELKGPWSEDARFNLEIVRKLLDQKQNQDQKKDDQEKNDKDQEKDQKDQQDKKQDQNKDADNKKDSEDSQNQGDQKKQNDPKDQQQPEQKQGPKDLSSALKEKEASPKDEVAQALEQEAQRLQEKEKVKAQPGQWQGVEKDW